MEQNIFDYLVEGLDLNAFYSFIDSKTDIDKNTPKFALISCFLHWDTKISSVHFGCIKVRVCSQGKTATACRSLGSQLQYRSYSFLRSIIPVFRPSL